MLEKVAFSVILSTLVDINIKRTRHWTRITKFNKQTVFVLMMMGWTEKKIHVNPFLPCYCSFSSFYSHQGDSRNLITIWCFKRLYKRNLRFLEKRQYFPLTLDGRSSSSVCLCLHNEFYHIFNVACRTKLINKKNFRICAIHLI